MVSAFPLALLAAALLLGALAELLHARRVRHVAELAFGPSRRPAAWARSAPVLRILAGGALAWGLATLLLVEPRKHEADGTRRIEASDWRHVLLVLDVSPSMLLADAGPERKSSRMERARSVLESLFRRVPLELHRITVIATYNGAKRVVEDTTDFEVVRNILSGLPMQHAFQPGRTRLFDGLEEAAEVARPWNPDSTTLLVVSDGDTVPPAGMPRMPASIDDVLVIGVGDPTVGKFIDGRQSRQDVPTLRQLAARLGGSYWNGNELQVPSADITRMAAWAGADPFERLTRREYALLACATGASLLAFLPLLLHFLGTRWRPGRAPAFRRETMPVRRMRPAVEVGRR
jgi:Ca-activated chloride channel family protein